KGFQPVYLRHANVVAHTHYTAAFFGCVFTYAVAIVEEEHVAVEPEHVMYAAPHAQVAAPAALVVDVRVYPERWVHHSQITKSYRAIVLRKITICFQLLPELIGHSHSTQNEGARQVSLFASYLFKNDAVPHIRFTHYIISIRLCADMLYTYA